MEFPIYTTHGNEITALGGLKSNLWKLNPPDLEQLEDGDAYSSQVENSIIQNPSKWGKFYQIDNQYWFNAEIEFGNAEIKSSPEENPLSVLWGEKISEVDLYDNYFVVNNSFYQILSLTSFMDEVALDTLTGLDFCLMYEQIDSQKAKSRLQLNRRMHYSSLLKGMKDIESEKSYQESEELLENIISGEEGLLNCEIFFIVKSQDKKSVFEKSRLVSSYIKDLGGKAFVEGRGLNFFLNTLIPGVKPSMKRSSMMPSSFMAVMASFTKDRLLKTGFDLMARSEVTIKFDLFDKKATNFNMLITGTSGQGKSMMANKLIWEELSNGTKGVILDLGNSFRKNVLYNEGIVLSEKFNPLQFKNSTYLKEFIIAATGEDWNRQDEGKLFELIEKSINRVDCFSELIENLNKEIPGIRYYFSEISKYFTNDEIPLNDLTYIDLTSYPESIKAPLMIYLIEYFKKLDGKKIFIFDECWSLLRRNSDYIAECFRTFRKHNASAIAISQNLDDFSDTQLGRVIIQNTFYKFMFKQSIEDSPFLTNFQIAQLKTIKSIRGEYSEFLVLSEDLQKPVRYYATNLEYELFTTHKTDNLAIEKYLEKDGSYFDFKFSMDNFIKIKYPSYAGAL